MQRLKPSSWHCKFYSPGSTELKEYEYVQETKPQLPQKTVIASIQAPWQIACEFVIKARGIAQG